MKSHQDIAPRDDHNQHSLEVIHPHENALRLSPIEQVAVTEGAREDIYNILAVLEMNLLVFLEFPKPVIKQQS